MRQLIATLVVTTLFLQSAVYAGDSDNLKGYDLQLGDQVTVFHIVDKKFVEYGTGRLGKIDLDDRIFLTDKQVYVAAIVRDNTKAPFIGWISMPQKKVKKSKPARKPVPDTSCPRTGGSNCCCNGSSGGNTFVFGGAVQPVAGDRYSRSNFYDNRRYDNRTMIYPQAPAPFCYGNCHCGRPMIPSRMIYRAGRLAGYRCSTHGTQTWF